MTGSQGTLTSLVLGAAAVVLAVWLGVSAVDVSPVVSELGPAVGGRR